MPTEIAMPSVSPMMLIPVAQLTIRKLIAAFDDADARGFGLAGASMSRSSSMVHLAEVPSGDHQDVCLVVNDFGRRGGAYCETDVDATDLEPVAVERLVIS